MGCFRGLEEEEISFKCLRSLSFSPPSKPSKIRASPKADEGERCVYHSAPLIRHSGARGATLPLPMPLPLPPPQDLRSGSCSSIKPASWNVNGSAEPKPLPPPKQQVATLKPFSWEEIGRASHNFSKELFCRDGGTGPVYATSLCGKDVDITRISSPPSKSVRKWVRELRCVARLQHPHLCNVVGFYVHISLADAKSEQIVVYARMPNASLDLLLYHKHKQHLDWPSRLKIALGAARGLAFLHELSPVEVAYRCFQTINIQVDRDLNARLSDYCFARKPPRHPDIAKRAEAYLAPETLKDGHVFPKSNVWSFGVVLLELLTGRQWQSMLMKLCGASVQEEKLCMIMDPQLKGLYPTRMANRIADLAIHCLQQDAVQRPNMKEIVNVLTSLHNSHSHSTPLLD